MTNPKLSVYDVPCEMCGAKADHGCRTPTSYGASPHRVRWLKIGIKRPSFDDRRRAYECLKQLHFAALMKMRSDLAKALPQEGKRK